MFAKFCTVGDKPLDTIINDEQWLLLAYDYIFIGDEDSVMDRYMFLSDEIKLQGWHYYSRTSYSFKTVDDGQRVKVYVMPYMRVLSGGLLEWAYVISTLDI